MKLKSLSIFIIAVFLTACAPPADQGGENPPNGKTPLTATVTQIGVDYLTYPQTFGFGKMHTDSLENIYFYSDTKKEYHHYTIAGGYSSTVATGINDYITNDGGIFYRKLSNNNIYDIYKINADQTITKTYELIFSDSSHKYREGTINDTDYIYVKTDYRQTGITIVKYNLLTDIETSFNLTAASGIFNIYGITCNNSNLYFISWEENANVIYTFDLITNTLAGSREILDTECLSPDSLKLMGQSLLVSGWNYYFTYSLDVGGLITGVSMQDIVDSETQNVSGTLLSDDSYIYTGTLNGLEGFFSFNTATDTETIISQPVVPDNALYNTWALTADDNNIYITCGKVIKTFANGVYQSEIEVPEIESAMRFDISDTGKIAIVDIESILINIDNGVISTDIMTDWQHYGIDFVSGNNFLIRKREEVDDDSIFSYDFSTKIRTLLFTKTRTVSVAHAEVISLPDQKILINTETSLQILSNDGSVLVETGSEYTQLVTDIGGEYASLEYLTALDKIIMTQGKATLYLIDPDTLSITDTITLPGLSDSKLITDITVNAAGEIFVITYLNTAYKIVLQ